MANVSVMRSLRAAEDFRRANWRTVAGILALTVVLSTAMDLFLTAENWTGFLVGYGRLPPDIRDGLHRLGPTGTRPGKAA